MKIFAYYLPQFHEIKENNKWWGEGFTEWTNVKAARKLYKRHVQPKHPLNGNYYNLLNKSVIEEQTTLMKQYGLDGFIYYHYYFTGKMLLEKPAENLLKWRDIQQPFFFCWANHDWIRSWEGKKELLQKQEYGGIEDWKRHFDYLLPFFNDDRYEKIDNKPVFMIYTCDFREKEEMFSYFDSECKKNGFSGLYLIETFGGLFKDKSIMENVEEFRRRCTSVTKAIHLREPNTSMINYHYQWRKDFWNRLFQRIKIEMSHVLRKSVVNKIDGHTLYQLMIEETSIRDTIHGIFFEWDNTPRHKTRGMVISPPDKDLFTRYMNLLENNEYLFVNAWNEWAEGMMLEPTEELHYKYLEWIKEWKDKHDTIS